MVGVLLTSDSIDRYRYLHTLRRQEYAEPEKMLMLAVLEDALKSLQKQIRAANRQGQKVCREVEEWLFIDASDGIFSFSSICDTLELSPACIRNSVLAWKKRNLPVREAKIAGRFVAPLAPSRETIF